MILNQTGWAQISAPETGVKERRALAPYAQVVHNDCNTFILLLILQMLRLPTQEHILFSLPIQPNLET